MSDAYARAGVDLDAAAKAVSLIGDLAAGAGRPEVRRGVGGFAGLFDIGGGRLLAAAADGVGTKIEIARSMRRLDTVGIDLVAMCADDVACTGAEPLFFLDYLAVGELVPEDVAAIVDGIAEGCRRAGCALLGGETAEHPGVMAPDAFDLGGFCVGVVDDAALLRPERALDGDILVGLPSSGLHSNGYSLVRRAMLESGAHLLDETPPGLERSLGEELLEPTRIYAPLVLGLARTGRVRSAAHITGGGIIENLPRALPDGLAAEVRRGSWPVPPVFGLARSAAGISEEEAFGVFNMGLGLVLVVPPADAEAVLGLASDAGIGGFEIGRVVPGSGVDLVDA